MQSSIELSTNDPIDMTTDLTQSSEILGSVVGMSRPGSTSLVHIKMEAPSLNDVMNQAGDVTVTPVDSILNNQVNRFFAFIGTNNNILLLFI